MKRLKFAAFATIIGGAMAVTAACGSDSAKDSNSSASETDNHYKVKSQLMDLQRFIQLWKLSLKNIWRNSLM